MADPSVNIGSPRTSLGFVLAFCIKTLKPMDDDFGPISAPCFTYAHIACARSIDICICICVHMLATSLLGPQSLAEFGACLGLRSWTCHMRQETSAHPWPSLVAANAWEGKCWSCQSCFAMCLSWWCGAFFSATGRSISTSSPCLMLTSQLCLNGWWFIAGPNILLD